MAFLAFSFSTANVDLSANRGASAAATLSVSPGMSCSIPVAKHSGCKKIRNKPVKTSKTKGKMGRKKSALLTKFEMLEPHNQGVRGNPLYL